MAASWRGRAATRSCTSSFRFAAASRETASGRPSHGRGREFRSSSTRFRAAPHVLDWTVPDEWNVRERTSPHDGRRIVDFQESNLHLVSYSEPFRGMSLAELQPHLHSLRATRTGFRTARRTTRGPGASAFRTRLAPLGNAEYEVVVDTTLGPGSLTYGEFLPGEREDEVLLTTHVCHPSLANDNLSGIAVLTELGALLARVRDVCRTDFCSFPARSARSRGSRK